MTIQQSIQRLSYTISKGHKPNETDKLALNKVIHDLNSNATANVQDNQLFAKLYAIILADFCKCYENLEFANKQINKELSYPIGVHIENLRLELTRLELQEYFKSKGVNDPLLKIINFETYKHIFPTLKTEEFQSTCETWDTDNTTAHFINAVNQSILCFKNLP
jgi:hypothetical protein